MFFVIFLFQMSGGLGKGHRVIVIFYLTIMIYFAASIMFMNKLINLINSDFFYKTSNFVGPQKLYSTCHAEFSPDDKLGKSLFHFYKKGNFTTKKKLFFNSCPP